MSFNFMAAVTICSDFVKYLSSFVKYFYSVGVGGMSIAMFFKVS